MSKTSSKNKIPIIVTCVFLAAAIVSGTFFVFRPYYYNNIYLAPTPANLSVCNSVVNDAVYGDFYVGPNGSDDNSGTQEFPFATIEKAQEAVRKLDKEYRNHVVVALLAGTYSVDTVRFSAEDSGGEDCRIIYAACGDGEVVFSSDTFIEEGSASADGAVIEIDGAEYLSFSNITVASSIGDGIRVNAKNVDFSGCKLQNIAGVGMIINGSNISVINCTFTKTGSSALTVSGGNTQSLASGNIVINNNLIYSTGVYDNAQPAVILGGVGNSFTNNEIYNAPGAAVYYSGNMNKIEYNYIHHCVIESDSMAAIAAPQGYVHYGNMVRYNCISTLGSGSNSPVAVAPSSGSTVRGNMVINAQGTAVYVDGGRDVNITNNMFINCRAPLVYTVRQEGAGLLDELKNSPYQSKAWKERLSVCSALSVDTAKSGEAVFALNPAGSSFENNIILQFSRSIGSVADSVKVFSNIGNNQLLALNETEIFVNAENGIYTIPDDVLMTLEIDFSNLPFDSMGRY